MLHVLTCSMYQEYINENGIVCNKIRRQESLDKIGACGVRYYAIKPLKCPCGYAFVHVDRYKPDPDRTLVQHLALTLLHCLSFQ